MVEFARLSKGLRRHIRQEKAAIRRQFNDTPEAREKIKLLIEKFFNPHTKSRLREAPVDGGLNSGVVVKQKVAPKVEIKNETPVVSKEPVKKEKKNAKRPQSRPRKAVK
ncbi:MAG: hypothetical protein HYT39_01365 [Candidatus Sungbacteria bacterium]|nr:hypothetical protein [Candidatus Sungbacteria bacterium]